MKKIFGLSIIVAVALLVSCASDEKETVNPAIPAASTAAPAIDIVYEKGFYPEEKDAKAGTIWRWMGTEGKVKVKNTKKDMILKIAGNVPLEHFPQPPTITVSINGEELEKFNATEGLMEKAYTIPAAKLGSGDYAEVKITSTKAFVPKDVVKGATDIRSLGFSLTNLTWQSK